MLGRTLTLLPLLLLAVACEAPPPEAASDGDPLPIAVTVAPHGWLVEAIGGDRVEVSVAVTPGQSPETFQPSDVEASRLLSSRIYFSTGVPAERGPWFQAVERRVQVVELAGQQGHDEHDHDRGGDHDEQDPHSWLDPSVLRGQAQKVAAALTAEDPVGASHYAARLLELEAELEQLDESLRSQLASHADRAFLIYHPAWGHFAARYGLRQLAIEKHGKTPSEVELTALRRQAQEERCRVVFVQPQISDRVAGLVAESLAARVETLDPLAADVPANLRAAADKLVEAFTAP